MRFLLIAIAFTAAAAAADQPPAELPRMSAEAYAKLRERGEAQRLAEVDAASSLKGTAKRERLAQLERAKGQTIPLLAYEIGSSGQLARCFTVETIIGPTTTIIRDANDVERRLVVDGVDNSKLVDHDGFTADGVLFEVDGRRTIAGATMLHLRAVRPPEL
jgi:hypothetical protein